MVRHIGIVGVSAEGAALCYRTICQEAPKLMGRYTHPPISMHTHSFNKYMLFLDNNDWKSITLLLLDSVNRVTSSGADFAIIPDNTVHRVFDEVAQKTAIPLISISKTVAEECRSRAYKVVGVLGTSWLMQGPVYRNALKKVQVRMVVPDKQGQEIVNSTIFNDLVPGDVQASSIQSMVNEIQRLKDRGCDAVILGCTEIPIIIRSENSPLPILDTTRLLARKALMFALCREK